MDDLSLRTPKTRDISQTKYPPDNIAALYSTSQNITSTMTKISELLYTQQIRLNALTQVSDEGLCIIDKEGKILLQNDNANQYIIEFCTCQKNQGCAFHSFINRKTRYQTEPEFINITGKNHVFSVNCKRLVPADSILLVSIKKLPGQESLNEKTLKIIHELTVSLAHEINNPLTPILGLTSPSMQMTNYDYEWNKQLNTIYQAGERIASVIQHLMTADRSLECVSEKAVTIDNILNSIKFMLSEDKSLKHFSLNIKDDFKNPSAACFPEQIAIILYYLVKSLAGIRKNTASGMKIYIQYQPDLKQIKIYAANQSMREMGYCAEMYKDFYKVLADILGEKIHARAEAWSDNHYKGYSVLF